jgi:hypothetical protein
MQVSACRYLEFIRQMERSVGIGLVLKANHVQAARRYPAQLRGTLHAFSLGTGFAIWSPPDSRGIRISKGRVSAPGGACE